ncbi:MAG: cation transporter [Candidatus Liberibacter ctenarytainae]|uniref:Cation transporter n=1 Tax=Candidatus Liberibacter ctenarytainae TaxID=2020335 RepID=A0A937APC2_9HYPH|nr:cation transporter [Candidatus Liberibacter ctenarytainae]
MQNYKARLKSEEGVLKLSIGITMLMALMNMAVGILSGASTIIFDSFYLCIDAFIIGISLFVTRLISRDALEVNNHGRKRYFQFGFWHLEPMVLAFNSIFLIFGTFFGLINSISSIMSGGHDVSFYQVALYSFIVSSIHWIMGIYEKRCNRKIKSDFIAFDARAWIISAIMLDGLFAAFLCGMLLKNSAYHWMALYVDPIVLMVICLCVLPSSIRMLKKSTFEIFQMTPPDLDIQVKRAVYPIVLRHGFLEFYTYAAKIGRARIIEIHLIVPLNYPVKSIASFDSIRHEIGAAIGGCEEDRWLTISFTAQKKWAV